MFRISPFPRSRNKYTIRAFVGDVLEQISLQRWTAMVNGPEIGCFRNPEPIDTVKNHFPIAGAMVYDSCNIGDEIQTIAQICNFSNSTKIVPINREFLNSYRSRNQIPAFLSGWFMHEAKNWPPNEFVKPMFIGFHIANASLASEQHVEFYKRWQPIGCRDSSSVQLLTKLGVDAFFTACPTLLLRRPDVPYTNKVLIVDADGPDPAGHIPSVSSLLSAGAPKELLSNATRLSHNVTGRHYRSHAYKMKRAIDLLRQYAGARLVITSRLHCALPCVAFGTPVVFLHKRSNSDPRIKDFAGLLNTISTEEQAAAFDWKNPVPINASDIQAHLRRAIKSALEEVRQR